MELYEKITFLRKSIGLSQQDLADKIDISRQSIYKWEQGLTSPDISKLMELAKIFGVTTDLLLDDKIEEKDITKYLLKDNTNENKQTNGLRRSIFDYLLLAPIILGGGILAFMFYCFGAMAIGFLYIFFACSTVAPFYGFVMIFANLSNGFGGLLICISIIISGLGLVFPLFLLSRFWHKKYIVLAKSLTTKIKKINWKQVL